jgi:uncharacterized radical SAM superfamily protein
MMYVKQGKARETIHHQKTRNTTICVLSGGADASGHMPVNQLAITLKK